MSMTESPRGNPLSPALSAAATNPFLRMKTAAQLAAYREAVLAYLRQIKADLAGDPHAAEVIYRVVNSTITA
ncbi:MAG TPA: hypothetical protein VGC27_01670 [Rhizomicrobium sp.]